MEFAIRLFFLVLFGAVKKLWLPAVLVIAAVAAIAHFSGGSALWAAGITAGIALIAAIIAAISGMNRGW